MHQESHFLTKDGVRMLGFCGSWLMVPSRAEQLLKNPSGMLIPRVLATASQVPGCDLKVINCKNFATAEGWLFSSCWHGRLHVMEFQRNIVMQKRVQGPEARPLLRATVPCLGSWGMSFNKNRLSVYSAPSWGGNERKSKVDDLNLSLCSAVISMGSPSPSSPTCFRFQVVICFRILCKNLKLKILRLHIYTHFLASHSI